MMNETTNIEATDHATDHAPAIVSEGEGDAMSNEATKTTGPTTQRSPGSEEPALKPARKKGSGKNGYPFLSKRQILARLETEPDFRREALLILHARQTEDEREAKETKHRNACGFMSSHAVNGTNLAIKLIDGEVLTVDEEGKLSGIVCRYSKQLAAHFRNERIAATPEVADKGSAYFMGQ